MNTVQKIYKSLYSLFLILTVSQTLPRNIVYYTINIYAFSLFHHNSLDYCFQSDEKQERETHLWPLFLHSNFAFVVLAHSFILL